MWLVKISDHVNKVIRFLLFPIFLAMFLVVFIAVVLRQMNISFVSSYDIARVFFIWMTYLGVTVIYKNNGHIKFNFFYDRFTGLKKYLLDLFINIVILITFIVIFYVSINFMGRIRIQKLPGSGIPATLLYLPFVFSSLILIIHSIAVIFIIITEIKLKKNR